MTANEAELDKWISYVETAIERIKKFDRPVEEVHQLLKILEQAARQAQDRRAVEQIYRALNGEEKNIEPKRWKILGKHVDEDGSTLYRCQLVDESEEAIFIHEDEVALRALLGEEIWTQIPAPGGGMQLGKRVGAHPQTYSSGKNSKKKDNLSDVVVAEVESFVDLATRPRATTRFEKLRDFLHRKLRAADEEMRSGQ